MDQEKRGKGNTGQQQGVGMYSNYIRKHQGDVYIS